MRSLPKETLSARPSTAHRPNSRRTHSRMKTSEDLGQSAALYFVILTSVRTRTFVPPPPALVYRILFTALQHENPQPLSRMGIYRTAPDFGTDPTAKHWHWTPRPTQIRHLREYSRHTNRYPSTSMFEQGVHSFIALILIDPSPRQRKFNRLNW